MERKMAGMQRRQRCRTSLGDAPTASPSASSRGATCGGGITGEERGNPAWLSSAGSFLSTLGKEQLCHIAGCDQGRVEASGHSPELSEWGRRMIRCLEMCSRAWIRHRQLYHPVPPATPGLARRDQVSARCGPLLATSRRL